MDASRGALPRHGDHQVRGRRRQGREADRVRSGRRRDGRPLRRPRTPTSRCACTAMLRPQLGALPALARVYADIEMPLVPVLERMERAACWSTRSGCGGRATSSRRACLRPSAAAYDRLGRRSTSIRRSSCRRSVRQACSCRCWQDAERPAVDGRGACSSSSPESYRPAAARPRISRPGEAEVDLHRQAAGRDQSAAPAACTRRITRPSRRPAACRRRIRTCRTSRSARTKGGAFAQAFVAPPGCEARRGRLFADRAADHGAPVGRRGPARGVSRRDRTSIARRPPKCSATPLDRGRDRSASLGEGDQLRSDLRHVARSGSPSSSASSAASAELHRPAISSAIPA